MSGSWSHGKGDRTRPMSEQGKVNWEQFWKGKQRMNRKVFDDIEAERDRQDAKWGVQSHPDNSPFEDSLVRDLPPASAAQQQCDQEARIGSVSWSTVLLEEVLEALEDSSAGANTGTLREELIQVAAVAAAWVEDIDRREGR